MKKQNKTSTYKQIISISIILILLVSVTTIIAVSLSSVDANDSVLKSQTTIHNRFYSLREMLKRLLELHTTTGSRGTIYIDPTYTGTSDGTIDHPYKGWDDVTIQSNTNYLQKRGTTYSPTTYGDIITADNKDNVHIGTYGTGAKPKIKDTAGNSAEIIRLSLTQGFTIDGFELIGSGINSDMVAVLMSGSNNPNDRPIKDINILNCTIHGFGTGTWYIPYETPYSDQAERFTLRNCTIYDIGTDGVFWVEIKDIIIEDCIIYNVAQIYNAGGDGIHLVEGCPNYLIKNNFIDRRGSFGKFCFIHGCAATWEGTYGRITGNTFYSPDSDPVLGGSAVYLAVHDWVLVDHNKFLGGGESAIFTQYEENVEVAYNLFYDIRGPGVIQADTQLKIHNNIIMSAQTGDPFLFNVGGDGICQLWNNIIASNNLPIGGVNLAYGTWNQKNNLIQDSNPSSWQSYFGIVNWANGDLHLTANSIARDTGYTYAGQTYDLDDNPTPQGIRDIGCYEYTTGGSTYTLTITTQGSGTVTKNPDQTTYQYNDIVILTANPSTSWAFDHWSGALNGNTNPAALTITGNMVVIAHFTQRIHLKVYLDGPFNGVTMNTHLNSAGFLPLTQPYSGTPWYYPGAETVPNIPNTNIVDWVLVELRDAPSASLATSGTRIARQAGFLLKNGTIVGIDGTSPLKFSIVITNNLYVVVWHRNHLVIMSGNALVNIGGVYHYDFTTSMSQAYGGNVGYKQIGSNVWGMYGGDGNADGQINNADKNSIWLPQVGLIGYRSGDFNLDTQVNIPDKNDIWMPNAGHNSQVPL